MSNYYGNVALTFTGDVILPTVLAGVAFFFGYKWLVDKVQSEVGVYSYTPCVKAWQDWANKYNSLISSATAAPNPQDFMDNDTTLLTSLSANIQCSAGKDIWPNEGTQHWIPTLQAEAQGPTTYTSCYNKAPVPYMNQTPCSLYNYSNVGTANDPCAGVGYGSMDVSGFSQPALCVASDIQFNANGNNNTTSQNQAYMTTQGNTSGMQGFCQYRQDVLTANSNIVNTSKDNPSQLDNWTQTNNPYAAYYDLNVLGTAPAGATFTLWPIVDQNGNQVNSDDNNYAMPPGFPKGGDVNLAVLLGNVTQTRSTAAGSAQGNGLGPYGSRDNFCTSSQHCKSGQCIVQTVNATEAQDNATIIPANFTLGYVDNWLNVYNVQGYASGYGLFPWLPSTTATNYPSSVTLWDSCVGSFCQ